MIEKGEKILVISKEDARDANKDLAIKMAFRELRKLNNKQVNEIFKRWQIKEVERGNTLSLAIDFADDVERFQWFYENEEAVLRQMKKREKE